MAADLDPLIKYRQHLVDEKRRFLANLYREAEIMAAQKKVIEDRMQQEIKLAEEMATPEAQASLGKYLEGARKKVKAVEAAMKKMDVRISAAQEEVRTAFTEVKKVEIVQKNREEREKAKQKAKEDRELDDIAIEGYRRNLEENGDTER